MEDLSDIPNFQGETPALWLPANEIDSEVGENEEENHLATPLQDSTTLALPSAAAMREELEEMVLRDLLGPAGGPDEELEDDRVQERYLVGMLAPNKLQTMPEEQDELGIAEEGGQEEGKTENRSVTESQPQPFIHRHELLR